MVAFRESGLVSPWSLEVDVPRIQQYEANENKCKSITRKVLSVHQTTVMKLWFQVKFQTTGFIRKFHMC